jgi:hypothetical protein
MSVNRSMRVWVAGVEGPGSRFFDPWPMTSCPLLAVKAGTRLISTCGPPTASHGIQML